MPFIRYPLYQQSRMMPIEQFKYDIAFQTIILIISRQVFNHVLGMKISTPHGVNNAVGTTTPNMTPAYYVHSRAEGLAGTSAHFPSRVSEMSRPLVSSTVYGVQSILTALIPCTTSTCGSKECPASGTYFDSIDPEKMASSTLPQTHLQGEPTAPPIPYDSKPKPTFSPQSQDHLPDWEISPAPASKESKWHVPRKPIPTTLRDPSGGGRTTWKGTSISGGLSEKINRRFPHDRRICGLRRKWFCILLCVLLVLIIALAVGLGIGLGRKSNRFIPLPSNAQTFSGDLTYYGPGLGACGVNSDDSSAIVAVSHFVFDAAQKGSDPNQNPLCGKKIRATRFNEAAGGMRSVDLTVVDRCKYPASLRLLI
jgi:hypothetical protein